MVKKIILIVLILSVMSGLFVCIISNLIALPYSADNLNYAKELYNINKSYDKYAKDYKDFLNKSKAELLSNISAIIICSALIPLCGFAIYELIRSIRHPMRYAVEGAQQSYADYKEWREKVRDDREAAAKEARRAELERELAELKKTE